MVSLDRPVFLAAVLRDPVGAMVFSRLMASWWGCECVRVLWFLPMVPLVNWRLWWWQRPSPSVSGFAVELGQPIR